MGMTFAEEGILVEEEVFSDTEAVAGLDSSEIDLEVVIP